MALSDHEQQMLDAIEQALFDDDPKFASSVDPARIRRRRPILAGLVFLVGIVALIVGVISTQQIMALGIGVSVVGFVIMVSSVGLLVYGMPGEQAAKKAKPQGKVSTPLTSRMEERFRRRIEDQ